jgi:RNA 2',3'-cyclic 3'-phosphodiesterase
MARAKRTAPAASADPVTHSDTARLFFALWPDSSVRKELAAWQRKLQQGINASAMRPWTLHLTLAFLGATPEAQFDAVRDAAAGARGMAFDLMLDKADYWPHNNLVWVGCSAAPPALLELQTALTSRLGAAGVAFDAKDFHPHVTLLRNVRSPKAAWEQSNLIWPLREFVLVESIPSDYGNRYEIVARFPLR